MSSDKSARAPYEAPAVTDFGTIEEITQGKLNISLNDFPVGGTPIGPVPPVSGIIPPPNH